MRVILLFSSCAFSASGAGAQAAELSLSAAPTFASYDAIERGKNNARLDEETGSLQGSVLTARLQAERHEFGIAAMDLGGSVDYEGVTQLGIPAITRTALHFSDYALSYAYRFDAFAAGASCSTFGVLGRRTVGRDILPTVWTLALSETLKWNYMHVGIRIDVPLTRRLRLLSAFAAERGLGSSLDVDFHGLADSATVRPSAGNGYAAEAGFVWQTARRFHFGATLAVRRQDYGASAIVELRQNGNVAGQLWYPGSTQVLRTFSLHAGADWP